MTLNSMPSQTITEEKGKTKCSSAEQKLRSSAAQRFFLKEMFKIQLQQEEIMDEKNGMQKLVVIKLID